MADMQVNVTRGVTQTALEAISNSSKLWRDEAYDFSVAAAQYATSAQTSAANATASEDNSSNNVIYAQEWAVKQTAVSVNAGGDGSTTFSAKYHANDSQLKAWEAEAEAMTAESYASEAVNTDVKEYISNGDGTFTAVAQVGVRSAFHYKDLLATTYDDHVGTGGAAHLAVTTTVDGFMSAADKTKLDGIEIGTTVQAYDANNAVLNTQQSWTAGQKGDWVDAPTGTFLLADGQNFVIRPTGNITVTIPADAATSAGQSGILLIDATTHTVSFQVGWYTKDGTAPTITGVCWMAYALDEVGNIGVSVPITNVLALT